MRIDMDKYTYVLVNEEHFAYDVHSMMKAFYPGKNIRCITFNRAKEDGISDEKEDIFAYIRFSQSGADFCLEGQEHCFVYEKENGEETSAETFLKAKRYKDEFNIFLYKKLSAHTGKELPWGNLTGIRPTKIACGMLDEGRSPEEILDFYRLRHFVSDKKAQLGLDIASRERQILESIAREPLGDDTHGYTRGYSLYIGIPFCPTTCLYCSFTSFPIAGYRKMVESYIDCVIKEMEFISKHYAHKILDSVYIGGGTPTTLAAEQLDRLITNLKSLFDFDTVKEFTVEAGRADSITEDKLSVLYRHGVSRISVNPQTMKQETLDIIGRRASVEQVLSAYELARKAGFDNINMDIILGLPGETAEDVRKTADEIVKLGPDSLTVHSLAIKRASGLNQWIQENGITMLKNTDETMEIAADAARRLGMEPYYLYRQKNMSGNFENVGYAVPGKYGLYNILIMEEVQDIVALGAGSISKRVYPDGRIERCENVKDVALYIEKIDEMIERKRRLLTDF